MTAVFDRKEVEVSERFVDALKELMLAEIEMMRDREGGRWRECWSWGRCIIGDLAATNGLSFEFGGAEDDPGDGLGEVAVLSALEMSDIEQTRRCIALLTARS